MTPAEKNAVALFLDLTADYLRDGYARERIYNFDDDPGAGASLAGTSPDETLNGPAEKLPLAYTTEEDDFDEALNQDEAEALKSPGPDSPESLAAEIALCRSCGLCETRTLTVPGEGVSSPLVMVIGEGPGADEDRAGRPFVGRAGQLLDRMLDSIGLSRGKNCYIANMVKCRPPGNRDPGPYEINACLPWLERQIKLLKPGIILCAGRVAAQNLLKTSTGLNALRGNFLEYKQKSDQLTIPLLVTFHPSAILREQSLKRPAWEDLKLLKSRLDSLDSPEEE